MYGNLLRETLRKLLISTFSAWILYLEHLASLKKLQMKQTYTQSPVCTQFSWRLHIIFLCVTSASFLECWWWAAEAGVAAASRLAIPLSPHKARPLTARLPGCRGCGGRPLFHCVLPARTMDQFQASTSQPPTLASNHTPEPLSTIGNIQPQLTQALPLFTLGLLSFVCLSRFILTQTMSILIKMFGSDGLHL